MTWKPPLHLPRVTDLAVIQRFLAKVQQSGEDDCWTWQGHRNPKGYGQFWYGGIAHRAHRVGYAIFVGEIEAGLTMDHTCCNRECVNPSHLVPVTQSVNSQRRWERARESQYADSQVEECSPSAA